MPSRSPYSALRELYNLSRLLQLHSTPVVVINNLVDFRALCDAYEVDRPVDQPEPDRFTYNGITVIWEPLFKYE
jgi:hypothetical protein